MYKKKGKRTSSDTSLNFNTLQRSKERRLLIISALASSSTLILSTATSVSTLALSSSASTSSTSALSKTPQVIIPKKPQVIIEPLLLTTSTTIQVLSIVQDNSVKLNQLSRHYTELEYLIKEQQMQLGERKRLKSTNVRMEKNSKKAYNDLYNSSNPDNLSSETFLSLIINLQKGPVSFPAMSEAESLNAIQENYNELSSNSTNDNESDYNSNGNYEE
ncbi:37767_t:CDS:2 [Gigaspora margarita]|uniref:37767_t:CDS:1 n=1 Tax=Gigaspora margarita TaxID=4874 RepID=A0ABN7W163_GIGMA|nr:37767_t:CDS:2 [Gigaspora margarita]